VLESKNKISKNVWRQKKQQKQQHGKNNNYLPLWDVEVESNDFDGTTESRHWLDEIVDVEDDGVEAW